MNETVHMCPEIRHAATVSVNYSSMLTIQNYAFKVVDSIVRNVVTLERPRGAPTASQCARAGESLLEMLKQSGRLQPSYWDADADLPEKLAETLNEFSSRPTILYFGVRLDPDASVAMEVGCRTQQVIAAEAKRRTRWITKAKLRLSPLAMKIELGEWLYAMRQSGDAEGAPRVAVGSISVR